MLVSRNNKKQSLTLVLLLACTATSMLAQGWHGIVPLKSTRVDVGRVFGQPKQSTANVSIYDFRGDEVFVVYSQGPCATHPEGWNVPRDTVVNLTITPRRQLKVAELKLDAHGYKLGPQGHVIDTAYYINEDAGITYAVDTSEGLVKNVTYAPTSKQASLRCPGADKGIFKTVKVGEYVGADLNGDTKLLNDFAELLAQHDSAYAYLIVYVDSSVTDADAIKHRGIIEEYLVSSLHLDARRIKVVDGGCRQKPGVELYVVPSGDFPPAATPDRECNRQ